MANEETLEDGQSDEELEKEIMEIAKNTKVKKAVKKEQDDEDDEDEDDVEENSKKVKKAVKKEQDDDEEDDEEDEEEMESKKSKKESKKSAGKKAGKDEEYDDEEEDEDEVEEGKMKEIAAMVKDGMTAEEIAKKLKVDVKDIKKTLKNYKEEIEVNVDEDVAALVDGEELSEDFKKKAATIFEAAVKSKISNIRKQIREESKKENDERTESMQSTMIESMDNYLNYATKEWMEENKLAVETGVRNEVTESFISGLKKLFEEHYIDVPDDKEDVFESLVVEVSELETKLDEQTEKHMETVKELNTYKAAHIFKLISEGMVDTDVEKFVELVEDVDYDTDEQYREKLNTIKNSYFKSDKKDVTDNKKTAGTNNPVVDGKGDGRMDGIMSAISKLSKK